MAAQKPHRPAFIHHESKEVITFGELEHRTNLVANVLEKIGISNGCRVLMLIGLKMDIQTVTFLYALLKTGATAIMPPSTSSGKYGVRDTINRLKSTFDETEPEVVITTKSLESVRYSLGIAQRTLKKVLIVSSHDFKNIVVDSYVSPAALKYDPRSDIKGLIGSEGINMDTNETFDVNENDGFELVEAQDNVNGNNTGNQNGNNDDPIPVPMEVDSTVGKSNGFFGFVHSMVTGFEMFQFGQIASEILKTKGKQITLTTGPVGPNTTKATIVPYIINSKKDWSNHPAIIIPTTGTTGPAKPVLHTHGMWSHTVKNLGNSNFSRVMGQEEGANGGGYKPFKELDYGMSGAFISHPIRGITTVMDPTKPKDINAREYIKNMELYGVTTTFISPCTARKLANYARSKLVFRPGVDKSNEDKANLPDTDPSDNSPIRFKTLRLMLIGGEHMSASDLSMLGRMFLVEGGRVLQIYGATEGFPLTIMSGEDIVNDKYGTWLPGTIGQDNERKIAPKLAELDGCNLRGGVCMGSSIGNSLSIRLNDMSVDAKYRDKNDLKTELINDAIIGEVLVSGPWISQAYAGVNGKKLTDESKIIENDRIYHKTGDVGYFDSSKRLWLLGRRTHGIDYTKKEQPKNNGVIDINSTIFTKEYEPILDQQRGVHRTAMISLDESNKKAKSNDDLIFGIVIERKNDPEMLQSIKDQTIVDEMHVTYREIQKQRIEANPQFAGVSDQEKLTELNKWEKRIRYFLYDDLVNGFPVDIRHHSKIERPLLKVWANGKKDVKPTNIHSSKF